MSARKRSRNRRVVMRITSRLARWWSACAAQLNAGCRAVARRLRPWTPEVAADVPGRRGRRLRPALARAARTHFRALGVTPPVHLLVVVQRTIVEEERPLAALLQVFEDGAGRRRHVLFLALSTNGRQLNDEDLVATLRQQLQLVVGDELGTLRLSAALEPARTRPVAVPIPLRRSQEQPQFDDEAPPPDVFEGYDDGAFAVAAER